MPGVSSLLNAGLAVAGGAFNIAGGLVRTSFKIAGDVAGIVLPGGDEAPPQGPPVATETEPGTTTGAAEAAAKRTRPTRAAGTAGTKTRTRRKASGATPRARAAKEAKATGPKDGPHTSADAAPSPAEMRELGRDVAEDDVELAASTADPGAEGGAGADITIEAPWDDYDALTAEDVERRLEESTPLVAAAVRIYEREHGGRPAVIRAAEQRIDSEPSVS